MSTLFIIIAIVIYNILFKSLCNHLSISLHHPERKDQNDQTMLNYYKLLLTVLNVFLTLSLPFWKQMIRLVKIN